MTNHNAPTSPARKRLLLLVVVVATGTLWGVNVALNTARQRGAEEERARNVITTALDKWSRYAMVLSGTPNLDQLQPAFVQSTRGYVQSQVAAADWPAVEVFLRAHRPSFFGFSVHSDASGRLQGPILSIVPTGDGWLAHMQSGNGDKYSIQGRGAIITGMAEEPR